MATIDVKDATGATVAIEKPLTPARKTAALSRPVVLSNEDYAALTAPREISATVLAADQATATGVAAVKTSTDAVTAKLDEILTDTTPAPVEVVGANYEWVDASATDQVLGATGATGDVLMGVVIVPSTTSPGAVDIQDGAGTARRIFAGGASSILTLHPIYVPLGPGIASTGGAWSLTTGANVTAIGVGYFT